jgi:hypothetical protein
VFRRGEKCGRGGKRSRVQSEDVERMCIDLDICVRSIYDRCAETHLCYSCAEKAPHEEFEALQFRLYYNQLKARLWIHISGLILDELNLLEWLGANSTVLQAPARHLWVAHILVSSTDPTPSPSTLLATPVSPAPHALRPSNASIPANHTSLAAWCRPRCLRECRQCPWL